MHAMSADVALPKKDVREQRSIRIKVSLIQRVAAEVIKHNAGLPKVEQWSENGLYEQLDHLGSGRIGSQRRSAAISGSRTLSSSSLSSWIRTVLSAGFAARTRMPFPVLYLHP
jgi:hypothetical protein